MVPETGDILPKDATCFLEIPVNKTSTAYTKPVHPLVGKRIAEWEQVRPKEQLREIDPKTGELVQFLFSYRGKRIWDGYINEVLIPLLCRQAALSKTAEGRSLVIEHGRRSLPCSTTPRNRSPFLN